MDRIMAEQGYTRIGHQAISTNQFISVPKLDLELFYGKENAITAQKLREGHTCHVTGYGQSMTPILKNGQSVICEPVTQETNLKKNDIVLCKVGGHYYLHKIVAIKAGDRFTIGNNHGHINGTISRRNIFGVVTKKL